MPRFSANLSMLFTERPFLDRFDSAARAGFEAVEFLFPYDHPAEEVAKADALVGFPGSSAPKTAIAQAFRNPALLVQEVVVDNCFGLPLATVQRRQAIFVTACTGAVVSVTSADGAADFAFTQASRVRRVGLPD